MVEVSADKKELQPIYLHAHELYMMNAFLEAARVGFCCLHIFQYIQRAILDPRGEGSAVCDARIRAAVQKLGSEMDSLR